MAKDANETEDEEGAEAVAKPKMGRVKLGRCIGLPVVSLLLAGVAAFMRLGGGGGEHEVQVAEDGHAVDAGDGHGAPAHEPELPPLFFTLVDADGDGADDPIITNIRSTDGRSVMVMLKVKLESTNPEFGTIIDAHVDQIMDGFIMFLRELREDDLYGSAGVHRVRLELLRRVNLAIEPAQADAVLIQELTIVD
jgi:flagellar FliL protein